MQYTYCTNQKIKFVQLREYKWKNWKIEKSFKKYDGETILRPFTKKQKLSISLDQQSKVLDSLFLLYAEIDWN